MTKKGEVSERKGKPSPNSGMKGNQRLKPYIILQILQQKTDENHLMSINDIVADLEDYGICAERRSVSEDIKAINAALWLLEERSLGDDSLTIVDAVAAIEADEDNEEKAIVYESRSTKERGFYLKKRKFDYQQIRLLAGGIYTSKFLSETEADTLASVLCEHVSDYQREDIKQAAYTGSRIKRKENSDIVYSLTTIDEAMAKTINGEKHEPEKISFQYYSYSISSLKQVPIRKGAREKVSPYKIFISDGQYYLLGFDDRTKKYLSIV